jgi:hypothetical protein
MVAGAVIGLVTGGLAAGLAACLAAARTHGGCTRAESAERPPVGHGKKHELSRAGGIFVRTTPTGTAVAYGAIGGRGCGGRFAVNKLFGLTVRALFGREGSAVSDGRGSSGSKSIGWKRYSSRLLLKGCSSRGAACGGGSTAGCHGVLPIPRNIGPLAPCLQRA